MTSSSSVNDHHLTSNINNEVLLHQSLLFADGLEELRNVKEQLYSAAEHFEDSYYKNVDQKQMLLESLKDYISKSVLKTIDHLGSVTHKVNNLLDEHVNQVVSTTNLRMSCIQQGLQTCQAYANIGGISQQLLIVQTPMYHKQYPCQEGCISQVVKAKEGLVHSSNLRKGYSAQASTELPSALVAFSLTKNASHKRLEKRSRSISPLRFSIKRSGSTTYQPTCPSFSVKLYSSSVRRSISPNASNNIQQQPHDAWRSHSLYPQTQSTKGMEVCSKKTGSLFKVLLSIYKSKNNNIQ